MKKWNWSLFLVIACLSYAGSLMNKNNVAIMDAFVIGSVFTIIFGLPLAYITKDEK